MQKEKITIGMKVHITSTKITNKLYSTCPEMDHMFSLGKIHTVTHLKSNSNKIQLDNEPWDWAPEDLYPAEIIEKTDSNDEGTMYFWLHDWEL